MRAWRVALVACVTACPRGDQDQGPRNRILHTGEPTRIAPLTLEDRFLEAIRRGDLASARALLAQGANARARDALGSSGLLLAARWSDSIELLQFLYEQAPELLDAPDASGRTPLSWAGQYDRVPALRFLAERGARIDAPDQGGRTPLFYAVGAGAEGAARFLLARGAVVNARDQYGDTPLMLASSKGNAALVALLLQAGADKAARNQEGRTARDRALNDEVRRLLGGG